MAVPEVVANPEVTEWPQVRMQGASFEAPAPAPSGPKPNAWLVVQSFLAMVPDQMWTVLATVLVMLFAKWLFMVPGKNTALTRSTAAASDQVSDTPQKDPASGETQRSGRWSSREPPSKDPTPAKAEEDQPQIPKSPTTKPQSFGPKETTKAVEADPPAKKEVAGTTTNDDKPKQTVDPPQKTAADPATTTQAPAQAKAGGVPKSTAAPSPQVTAQVMFKSLQDAKTDIQGLSTRVEAIEKVLGIISEKVGPLHANVVSVQKSQDSHYKEFAQSFAKVCGSMRCNFEESQQLARDNYHNMEQRLGAVESKLVGGIQKTLEKITNCDYQTNQSFGSENRKHGVGSFGCLAFRPDGVGRGQADGGLHGRRSSQYS